MMQRIHRRDFIKTAGAAIAAGACSTALKALAATSYGAPKAWNIVFITSDEHNAKIMGCAGNPVIKTPACNRLAREGVMFTRAYAADPLCAPTRQSFITGRYPQEHGQFSNKFVFDPRNLTWASHFKKHGYQTASIGKTHTYQDAHNLGYDYRVEHPGAPSPYDWRYYVHKLPNEDEKIFKKIADHRLSGYPDASEAETHDGKVVAESLNWIRKNKDQKFFIHVSMIRPHFPWTGPKNFYYMYDPKLIDCPKIIPGDLDDDAEAKRLYIENKWNEISEDVRRLCRARYYGSLSWLDSNIGKVLDLLDELKLTEKTLVIYSTDHGDMAGEKGMWLKSIMFDSAARVPLLMRMPGVLPAGKVCDTLLNHVDYFPTIASLVGAATGLPANLSGKDISGIIFGKSPRQPYTYSVHNVYSSTAAPGILMVRSPRWKFIRYARESPDKEFVLYDMEQDPDEIVNRTHDAKYATVLAEHKKAGEHFLASLKQPDYPPKKHNNTEE